MRAFFALTISSLTLGAILSSCTINATIRDPQTTYDEGVELVERGNYRQGIEKLSQTIVKTPDFAAAYVNRGIAYAGLGQHDLAIADFTEALALVPAIPEAYYNRGNSYVQLNDVEKAIADYSRVIALNPTHAEAHGNRAMMRLQQGDEAGAIADLEEAVKFFTLERRKRPAVRARKELDKLRPSPNAEPEESEAEQPETEPAESAQDS